MGAKNMNCLEKRDLLNRTAVSVERMLSWGEFYEERGQVHDAVDFYLKANASEPLSCLLDKAREEGDLFLYQRLCQALGIVPGPEEWMALAREAQRLGKNAFADRALRLAGDEEAEGGVAEEP